MKNEEEYSRPDKGERVKVTIAIRVEEVRLDSSIARLRVKGSITETSDESVGKAGSHSVSLTPGHSLTLRKDKWNPVDIGLVESTRSSSTRFLMIAIDRREAGVGTLSGSHLSVVATVDSGLGGKMFDEQSSKPYFAKVLDLVRQTAKEDDEVVVAGPGQSKSALANLLSGSFKGRPPVRVVEGFDLAGTDGVRGLTKYSGFQDIAKGSAIVEIQRMVVEAVKRLSMGDTRVCYTLPRVKAAALLGAVESCAVSDDVFSNGVSAEELVSTLAEVESQKGKVYLADSSLEFGKQISSFGGIIALLRYPVKL